MVAACDTPSVLQYSPVWREVLARLGRLASELEVLTCSVLPFPSFIYPDEILLEKKVKKFLVGILENHAEHPWKSVVSSLSCNDRTLVSGTLFLARKILPPRQDPLSPIRHANLMSQPLDCLPPWYSAFADFLVGSLFPVGWDRSYFSACESVTPSVSSCLEKSRASGGVRGLRRDRSSYVVETSSGLHSTVPTTCDYREVFTSGKYRGVTVTSARHDILKPLHNIFYDQLSKRDWLLRGDAVSKRFEGFEAKQGEIFVSGDYESATDNLSQAASMVLLKAVLRRCRNVPKDIRQAALQSLCAEINYGDHVVVQRRGQLMGNYLSFPLLCLHNYVMFRSEFGVSTPVRINGDDIVFRSTRRRADRWANIVGLAGLKLSAGKTLFHSSVFSLNSTFFRAKKIGLPRLIPVIRSLTVWKPSSDLYSLGSTFRRFIKGWGNRRDRVGSFFLRERSKEIYAGGRSILRGLRLPASVGMLQLSGFYRRECLYFHSFVEEATLPKPTCDIDWECVPSGWERVYGKPSRVSRHNDLLLSKDMIRMAWLGRQKRHSERDWWIDAKCTGRIVEYRDWTSEHRSNRLWRGAGGFNHQFRRLFRNPVNDCMRSFLADPPTASMVWRRVVKTRHVSFLVGS
nr:MAG: RNA-dependent RNA polymerase [Streptophyte associated botourmia-like virus 11]